VPDLTTAALWAIPGLALLGCAAYAARAALRGHTGSPGPLGCLRRILADRAARAALNTAIAALTARRKTRDAISGRKAAARPERSRT